MRTVNLWESNFSKHYQYVDTIEEVLNLIDNEQISVDAQITDKYIPGQPSHSILDDLANKQNIEVIYTDNSHIVAYSDDEIFKDYINPNFFEKHKKALVPTFQKQILKKNSVAWIQKEFFDENFFEQLLTRDDLILNFVDIDLTSEQIQKLKENHITAYLNTDEKREQISDNILFCSYTKKDLAERDYINIRDNLTDEEIENFLYLKDGVTISFNVFDKYDLDFYKKAKHIIGKTDELGKKISFDVRIGRRSWIALSGLLDMELQNVNLTLCADMYSYSVNEYKEEELKLNTLVKDVKESDMSPFEKYICVYNIVKNYKPYKESPNKQESRHLRYILDNEYMVCGGYSNLFVELLDKVGIYAQGYSTDVDVSYDKGFTQEEKTVDLSGHRRVVVSLDDDKYNIHGIYVSDPTWDNNLEQDYYNHMIMTFDSMRESHRMFRLTDEDLIFDVDSFSDFVEKTNKLIQKKISESYWDKPMDRILYAYNWVCDKIVNTLRNIDDNGWKKLIKYEKVNKLDRDEKFYTDFLTDAGHYIVKRTNNKIPRETIMEAIATVKVGNDKDNLEGYKKTLEEQYIKRNEKAFPYEITDTNNKDDNNSNNKCR